MLSRLPGCPRGTPCPVHLACALSVLWHWPRCSPHLHSRHPAGRAAVQGQPAMPAGQAPSCLIRRHLLCFPSDSQTLRAKSHKMRAASVFRCELCSISLLVCSENTGDTCAGDPAKSPPLLARLRGSVCNPSSLCLKCWPHARNKTQHVFP